MSRGAVGLLPLKGAQARAAAPQAHVWLSASAGTGKTHVLTARVFRLLLGGVDPEHILCLTFTKAGASEMAERVHARLAAWVQMSDADLAADLHALGEDISPPVRERARRLFARVLEATGGGLAIQTIHSFCQRLLASFPLEAGLVPGFRALEESEQQELARLALEELVIDAEAQGDDALIDALHALALRLGEAGAERYLHRCARAHDAFARLPDDLRGWLFAALELPQDDIEEAIAAACVDKAIDGAGLRRLARANADWGTKTGLGYADCIDAWLGAAPPVRAATLDDLGKCFLTGKGEPRAVSAGQIKADEEYQNLTSDICDWISELLALRTRAAYADAVAQALVAGRAYARAYEAAKRRTGAVDFDDLIAHGAALLGSDGIADWIRYKLDARIDHILVDEAQDTNSRQWTIINALVDEFFSGEGARGDRLRTLFTVGDFKQAIFGFQGTSPRAFAEARDHFRARAYAAEHIFHDLSLDESFRSTPAVLEAVDACVEEIGPEALGLPPGAVHHESRNRYPGRVALWKPVSAVPMEGDAAEDDEAEGAEDWLSDQDRLLAERIARQIRGWIAGGMMLASKGRPVQAGDIMILLRRRGDLARLIVARLYEAGVPVAGVDRLRLQAPLGVQDLMAALRFAAQPEDDLNLACLLVSPLIGWTQDELWQRAAPRTGSLWRHLRESGAAPADDMSALYEILARADFITPYRLLEHILSGPMQGRRRLVGRLGAQALDSIEELLNAALRHEQQEMPSLQHFIDWFDREEGDIKRESEGGADAVRILTVHGAKGLQAPVVILADACADPDAALRREALDIPLGDGTSLPVLPPRRAERWGRIEDAAFIADATERQEHWRLLYVAMTRAEEQLYVTGALGPRAKGKIAEASWYACAERGLAALGAQWGEDADWGATLEWSGSEALAPKAAPAQAARAVPPLTPLPEWARQPAPAESRPSRPLAPTAPGDDDLPMPPPSTAMQAAALRGQLLHSLFERLPDVAPEERRDAALRWLERQGGVADSQERAAIADQALAVINDPQLDGLFGPDALAEAPIAAVVGEDVVQGVIDRLVIRAETVHLVDFKTGRVPEDASAIPVPHLRQMAAYAAALAVIFTDRVIEATLLYTAGPRIFPLSATLLAPHKPGFSPQQ